MSDQERLTAIALITAVGLEDECKTFTAILNELTRKEAQTVIVDLVGMFRGGVRGIFAAQGIDGDLGLKLILESMGEEFAS